MMSGTIKLPEFLEIVVKDSFTRQPVPQMGIMLTIFAPLKNHYHLAKVTDFTGRVRVSQAEIYASIRADQELFPMDYASALDQCSDEIEVKICSDEEVQNAARAMEMFKSVTKIDDALIQGFKGSQNKNYRATSQLLCLDRQRDDVSIEILIQRVTNSASDVTGT